MAHDIQVGDLFPSFQQLKEKITLFENENKVRFYIRDGRTLNVAQRRRTQKKDVFINPEVKYYQLKYCCIHGGMKFKKRKDSTGERQTSTFKQGCKASISLKMTEDGQHLQVSSIDKEHNHEVSDVLYKRLPRHRKLTADAKSKAAELLGLGANKKLVRNKISEETGILVTAKTLSDIVAGQRRVSIKTKDLLEVVKTLEEKYHASVRVAADEEMNLRGLFIQDEEMRKCYNAYPEFVCADSTFKLVDIKVPVYVLMVEDSNGQSEVAAVGLLVSEDEDTLNWFVETFKQLNPDPSRTRVVMTDKGIMERTVFKKNFPNASLFICAFHTLRAFRREVAYDKFGITPGEQNYYREVLQKMTFAKSQDEYHELYRHLQTTATPPVLDYFHENWHPIREEWTMGMKFSTGSFLDSTNHRVESFNAKIKSIVGAYSTLETFVDNLYLVLASLRRERDREAALMVQKIPTNAHAPGSPEAAYLRHLTQYAFKHVAMELVVVAEVRPPTEDGNDFVFETSEGSRLANAVACQCTFYMSMRLPCRHMFVVREKMELDVFDPGLCDERWSRKFYRQTQRIFQSAVDDGRGTTGATGEAKPKAALSVLEKFKAASELTNKLTSIVAEASGAHFERRMNFLRGILTAWEAGKDLVNDGSDKGVSDAES